MPNHITNSITLSGDKEKIAEMMENIKNDEVGIGSIDFNKIIPMPESLKIESGSATERGYKAYKNFMEVYTLFGTTNMDEFYIVGQYSLLLRFSAFRVKSLKKYKRI